MADSSRTESLRKILKFVRPFKGKIVSAIILTVILNLIGQIPPWIEKYFIDSVITGGEWDRMAGIMAAMISVPFASYLLSFWNNFIITYVGQKLVFDIRRAMYEHLVRLSLRFHGDMGTGKVISRLMGDSATIQNMMTLNTISMVNNLISFSIGIVVIFSFNWKLSLVTLVILPLHWLNYHFFVKRIRHKTRRIRRKWDQIYNQTYERLNGTKLVQTFTKEDIEAKEFVTETTDTMGLQMENVALNTSFGGLSGLIHGLGHSTIFCLGCYYVIQGEMTYGTVAAFMAYVNRVLSPVLQFTNMSNQIEQTLVSADRVFEIQDTELAIQDAKDAVVLPPVRGDVKFEHVNFEYEPDKPILQDFSLGVPAGTTVALVGHTGCGKTTLTSLLLRFYDIQSGRITVDGHDISTVTVRSLRNQIGQVLQDSILFSESTVRDNIAYGVKEPTDAQIMEAAKVGEIHDFIQSKPEGYDEWIGGRGLKLSVGEKQRMCIARAVITDPGILIMDEATSSLDSQSEALIQKALENVMKNRTSFVIAHRLSTIVNADMIVVMDEGEIVEKGTHQELLQKEDGQYRKLYEQQYAAAKKQAKWE
ncbi:MAG: ABC transporter ATP-binding protein [Candidatus Latescibacteria bacterium]|nr:ABC transporter ATP-binding protein [Candidatus Latescibacterota bacterium]